MNDSLINALIVSLVLTIFIESGFFLLTGKRNRKDLILVVLTNIITNPVVVLLYWLVALNASWSLTLEKTPLEFLTKILLEFFAIVTEGRYYKKYGREFRRPYVFSVAANTASFGAGILILNHFPMNMLHGS